MGMETSNPLGGGASGAFPNPVLVKDLLNDINGRPAAPAKPDAVVPEKPVSAGVSSQPPQTKVPPTMGRSAPKETEVTLAARPAASIKAKDLGPAVSVTSTSAFSREGLLTQAGVSATFKLDGRTSVTTTLRERLRDFSQPGKESVLDTRLSAQIKLRAVDEPQVKLDLSLEGYGQFNQPQGGGNATMQLGLRPGFGLTYSPTKDFSLGLNGYADLSRTFPAGTDSILVGGDGNASLKFGDGFKATAGVRVESPNLLATGGSPRVAGFGSVSKQFGEHFSVGAEVVGGFVGDPTLSTSFAGAGDVTGVIKATYTF